MNLAAAISSEPHDDAKPGFAGRLRRLQDVPGPRGLPLLGNLLQIRPTQLHRQVEDWTRRYGPFVYLRLGGMRVLAVADHDEIVKILRQRPGDFSRMSSLIEVGREMGFKSGLFTAEGQAWQHQRSMVMASFSPAQIKAYFAALVLVTQKLQRRWMQAAAQQTEIDLQADLMLYTVDVTSGLAFGVDANTLECADNPLQDHVQNIYPIVYRRMLIPMLPYWRWFRLPSDRRLDRSIIATNEAIDDFIAQARARLRDDPSRRAVPPNLLEAFIVAADQPDSGINDDDVAGNVLAMLLGGEDTSANTLAWLFYFMGQCPDVKDRAAAELRALLPRGMADVTPETVARMDYVEACVRETMRLKPVSPIQPVEAARDVVIADIAVPRGTTIFTMHRPNSVSAEYFDDPAQFRPERWLPAAPAPKAVSLPFGAGPRICPGRYLALIEMKIALAMLLSSFDIVSVGTQDGKEPAESLNMTMSPVGLKMRLRPGTV